jgi:SAM-dependent methyltransferase
METKDKEKIRKAVRDKYGGVARANSVPSETALAGTCCSPADFFSKPSLEADCGCGVPGISKEKLSGVMGYSKEEIDSLPEGANLGLGCGNPVAIASLKPGQTVVDFGSGAGVDCFLAAKQVGEEGRVIGVDMTPDMVSKARANAEKAGIKNVEFRLGEIEHLPVADNSVDIIISNCVINLSPDKPNVYRDAFRVLKPGGRLSISDIVATVPLPDDIQQNMALVTACVGGAATMEETEGMLREAGFESIRITPKEESREIIRKCAPGTNVDDYVVSAYIEAEKPN